MARSARKFLGYSWSFGNIGTVLLFGEGRGEKGSPGWGKKGHFTTFRGGQGSLGTGARWAFWALGVGICPKCTLWLARHCPKWYVFYHIIIIFFYCLTVYVIIIFRREKKEGGGEGVIWKKYLKNSPIKKLKLRKCNN